MEVYLSEFVMEYITKEANIWNDAENFGWLIGFLRENKLYAIAPYSCEEYEARSQLMAAPSIEETRLVSEILPLGMSVIGIYHTHLGEVFHSHVDEKNIAELESIFPQAISVVTNGTITKCFKKGKEIEYNVGTPSYSFTKVLAKIEIPAEDTTLHALTSSFIKYVEKNIHNAEIILEGRVGKISDFDALKEFNELTIKFPDVEGKKIVCDLPFYVNKSNAIDIMQLKSYIIDRGIRLLSKCVRDKEFRQPRVMSIEYIGIPLLFIGPFNERLMKSIKSKIERFKKMEYIGIAKEFMKLLKM